MVVTDLLFLLFFLPLSLIIYYFSPSSFRTVILLLLSLFFYAAGSPQYMGLLLFSIFITILLARCIEQAHKTHHLTFAKIFLALGCCYNIVALGYYKYWDFLIININQILYTDIPTKKLLLPLGISFFTFKAISYLADVYMGKISVRGSELQAASYLSFFAQMQSGPLSRYSNMYVDTPSVRFDKSLFSEGIYRIVIGFNKKILLANTLYKIVNEVFSADLSQMSSGFAWLGTICFALQLYFDFSGYSDIAIGITNLFGFHCPENFTYPYMTASVAEFWRRWHITLGSWFREYIYIPMGGSRVKSSWRLYFNLFVVWMATGIWHGAQWNYVIWGLGYFVVIAFEKSVHLPQRLSPVGKFLYRLASLLFINIQWVFFRSPSLSHAVAMIKNMFLAGSIQNSDLRALFLLKDNWLFILTGIILCFPIFPMLEKHFTKNKKITAWVWNITSTAILLTLFFCALSFVIAGQNNPFLYANF